MEYQTNLQKEVENERKRNCPFCQTEFSPRFLHREFCSQKCKNSYHNHKKRLEKRESMLISVPVTTTQNVPEHDDLQIALQKNIEIFTSLPIEEKGSHYFIVDLIAKGFKCRACSFRYKLCRTENSYVTVYGHYHTVLVNPDKLLIHLKKY